MSHGTHAYSTGMDNACIIVANYGQARHHSNISHARFMSALENKAHDHRLTLRSRALSILIVYIIHITSSSDFDSAPVNKNAHIKVIAQKASFDKGMPWPQA